LRPFSIARLTRFFRASCEKCGRSPGNTVTKCRRIATADSTHDNQLLRKDSGICYKTGNQGKEWNMDMEIWKAEIMRVIDSLLGHPPSHMEAVVLGTLTLIVFYVALGMVADGFKIPMSYRSRTLVVTAVTLAAMLAAVVASNLYLQPRLSSLDMKHYAPWAAAVLALLVIAVPAMCFLQKANYFQGTVSLLLSIVVAAAIMIILQTGIASVRQGAIGVDAGRKEKDKGVDAVLSK
jgi:hypothetical protein